MARKKKFDYFEALESIAKLACEYSDRLVDFLEGHYSAKKHEGSLTAKETLDKLSELHAIEDDADRIVSDVTAHLVDEFMTPIEREDILTLVYELDDVVDELDDVLQRMYMFNVTLITPELIEMAKVVQQATDASRKALKRLANYKKTKTIKESIDKIHELEDEGDLVYIKSVHAIYVRAGEGAFANPLTAHGLHGVLQALEYCCDSCESVADTMVTVVMKNN